MRLVVCAGILLWVLFTIPRLLEKVGLALDVKSMTHLYSYTFGEEFELARSCAPLMRTVHTMVGTTLAQLLSMVVCMVRDQGSVLGSPGGCRPPTEVVATSN